MKDNSFRLDFLIVRKVRSADNYAIVTSKFKCKARNSLLLQSHGTKLQILAPILGQICLPMPVYKRSNDFFSLILMWY